MLVDGFTIFAQGLLLGLSNGATCLATCAPVLIPLFLAGARTTRGNAVVLAEFLGGRLAGYLVFGLVAWTTGRLFAAQAGALPVGLTGLITLALGVLMFGHGIAKVSGHVLLPAGGSAHAGCAVSPWRARSWLSSAPRLMPIALGWLSGLSFCPPLIVALIQGALHRTLAGSVLFFGSFFVGTSLFFVPTPFLGAFRRHAGLAHVGSFAAILVGLYYLYSGSMHLLVPTSVP